MNLPEIVVAVMLGQRADASALAEMLHLFLTVDVWTTPPTRGEPNRDYTQPDQLPALLIVDGLMLWRHSDWIRSHRSEGTKSKVFVLLLLAPGRMRMWPEQKYRGCYDDVLQGPLDRTETLLRIQQLLLHRSMELENAHLLQRSLADAESLREEKKKREHLIATLGHDLRSPLTAARLNAERLRGEVEPDVRHNRVGRVLVGLDRIDGMITEIINAARIERHLDDSRASTFCNLRQLASSTIADLKSMYGDRFVLDVEPKLECLVQESSIVRVIENLCTNAVKYGDEGTPIVVRGFVRDGQVSLQVANQGKALSEGSMLRLFGAYERGHDHEQDSSPTSWGLGLSMVRSAAEAHHGTPHAYRDAEQCNVFGLNFPLVVYR